MELDIYQQIFDLIKRAGKILIVLPQALTADSLASGAALFHFLKKLQKDAEFASSGVLPANMAFLPDVESLESDLPGGNSLVVSLNTRTKKLAELSYQTKDDVVNIFLKSKSEPFDPEDVSFAQEKFPVDLIFTLGCASLANCGVLFERHTDLFYETPKVNIDNKAANELFGAVNLVDITATSIAEILALLFEKYEDQLVDEDIATQLLAGIIATTHSFQHPHTTPRSFLKASDLVALGGRQQEIVKNIFKTKPLALLKLWGRALARMVSLEDRGVIYSVLSLADFQKAEAGISELYPVLREFSDNVSDYRLIALVAEAEAGKAEIMLAINNTLDYKNLLQNLGSQAALAPAMGNFKVVQISLTELNSLSEAEQKFLELVKSLS